MTSNSLIPSGSVNFSSFSEYGWDFYSSNYGFE